MNIKNVVVGNLETNCYILEKDGEVLIIDPGDDANKIIENVNGNVVGIIVTHHHFDHVGALESVKTYYNTKVYDYSNLNKINNVGVFAFEVIPTPGHTDDSISVYFKEDNIMFVGDFVFFGSIGRTDLGGNNLDMKKSIETILLYNDSIKLYPGHGKYTFIGDERDNLILFSKML